MKEICWNLAPNTGALAFDNEDDEEEKSDTIYRSKSQI